MDKINALMETRFVQCAEATIAQNNNEKKIQLPFSVVIMHFWCLNDTKRVNF